MYGIDWFATWHCELKRTEERTSLIDTNHVLRISTWRLALTRLTSRQGSWLQGMEDTVGGLPQPLRPRHTRGRQTGTSTNLVFLSRNRNHRRKPWPQRRPARQSSRDHRGHSTLRGRSHQRIRGETYVPPPRTAAGRNLRRLPSQP